MESKGGGALQKLFIGNHYSPFTKPGPPPQGGRYRGDHVPSTISNIALKDPLRNFQGGKS